MTAGPNPVLHHLYSPGSKNALPFLSGGRKKEECFVTRERLNEIQTPAPINEVFTGAQLCPLGSLLSVLEEGST